jgi:hypothetical protein
MNISDIATSIRANAMLSGRSTTAGSTASSSVTATDPIAQTFAQANKRVQQQLDVTSAQLSSFGKLKSAFADVQGAAKALSNPKASATDADISQAATDFVKAFNSALKTAQTSQTQATSTQEVIGARRAQTDLRRVLGSDSSLSSSLKGIGITQLSDGSLAIDATKFQAATKANASDLRATIAKLGQQGQAVATRELADSGNVGGAIKALSTQSNSLKARQSEQQAALASFQQFAKPQSNPFGSSASNGLAAYASIYSSF